MKKSHIIIAIIGFVLVIAAVTNPNADRHKEVIKAKLNAYMQKSMAEEYGTTDNTWEKAGQALGMMFSGAIVDGIVANIVSTDNYILFSTTKVSWAGDTKVIGIGAFGNVFINNELDEALNEGLLNQ